MIIKQPKSIVLDVFLGTRRVGAITTITGVDLNVFTFDEDYIRDKERPTLSLSFQTAARTLLTKPVSARIKLPPFFSNLLPEGHLRNYLAQSNGIHKEREFYLLMALGADLPGAITARLATENSNLDPNEMSSKPLIAGNRKLRFSLAGVQMKFSAIQETKGGMTIPVEGMGGQWIVKLPSVFYPDVPANEFSMLELARSLGIEVSNVKLINTKKIEGLPQLPGAPIGDSLAIERFDRNSAGGRIHIEDLAQVYGLYPDAKYQDVNYNNIAAMLWIETGAGGISEFVKRLVFNVAIGNADMHLKNWSLIYRDGRKPELSPAYDLVSTIVYTEDRKMALTLGKNKEMHQITIDDFKYLAQKAKIPESLVLPVVTQTVSAFREVWHREMKNLQISKQAVKQIEEHWSNLPLFSESRALAIRKPKTAKTVMDLKSKTSKKAPGKKKKK